MPDHEAPDVYHCDEWTDAERRVMRETLETHLRVGQGSPFGEYDPTAGGAVVAGELASRGFDVETTLVSPHSPDGGAASWHECRVAAPGRRVVVVRAPTYDQAVAQAAVWSLGTGRPPAVG